MLQDIWKKSNQFATHAAINDSLVVREGGLLTKGTWVQSKAGVDSFNFVGIAFESGHMPSILKYRSSDRTMHQLYDMPEKENLNNVLILMLHSYVLQSSAGRHRIRAAIRCGRSGFFVGPPRFDSQRVRSLRCAMQRSRKTGLPDRPG